MPAIAARLLVFVELHGDGSRFVNWAGGVRPAVCRQPYVPAAPHITFGQIHADCMHAHGDIVDLETLHTLARPSESSREPGIGSSK
ncbi:MAG TPA: hypothetical protein VF342_06100 [Alphaproteobacteria bacterium]